MTETFTPVEDAIAHLRRGGFVVVLDDARRENEGDLIIAAENMTPAAMTFMRRHTSGVVRVSLPPERLDELRLPLMVMRNSEPHGSAFTVSVDYRHDTTSGVSNADRAATIRALANRRTRAEDFTRPGHVFPLRCSDGGVLKRAGHTEAASDLARLAGLYPAGALAEIVDDDGAIAQGPALHAFAERHGLPIITIAALADYRQRIERLYEKVADARLPTKHGEFVIRTYRSLVDGSEQIALIRGEPFDDAPVLVRVHSECLTGDVFGSTRCDCGEQLDAAMARIAEAGRGVIVYLRGHEGRGIGLSHKLRAYRLQDSGRDTVEANLDLGFPADMRSYAAGAQILKSLRIAHVTLLTNNPDKVDALKNLGIDVVGREPLTTSLTRDNLRYLQVKQQKMGHLLSVPDALPISDE